MGQFAVGNYCNAFQSSFASVFLIYCSLYVRVCVHTQLQTSIRRASAALSLFTPKTLSQLPQGRRIHMPTYIHT